MNPEIAVSWLRSVDRAAITECAADQRYSQQLAGPDATGSQYKITYVRTPPGGGSPEGTHSHAWDQAFYVVEGSLRVEVDGRSFEARADSLVVFPAGIPHRSWNAGSGHSVHLAIDLAPPG